MKIKSIVLLFFTAAAIFLFTGCGGNEINGNTAEYANWARQGIFKALPDLSRYPNIKKELDSIAADDSMLIDGKLYCIPKTMKSPIDGVGPNFSLRGERR